MALKSTLIQSGAKLVHAHFGFDGARILRASRLCDLPLIVTFHGYDATTYPENLQETPGGPWLLHEWTRLVTQTSIIAVSRFIRDELIRRGADPERITVVPCGVDTNQFSATPVPRDSRILFVGRLVEKKGTADLINAVAGLEQPPTLDIVGEGPLRLELERLAARLRVKANFYGRRDSSEVKEFMRSATVVAIPSKRAASGDCEGLPVAALEAGASGRAVVGYSHSGIPEAIDHGRTGMLAAEGDVAALRHNLSRVLEDRDLAQNLGTSARQKVVREFQQQHLLRRVEDVYETSRDVHSSSRRTQA